MLASIPRVAALSSGFHGSGFRSGGRHGGGGGGGSDRHGLPRRPGRSPHRRPHGAHHAEDGADSAGDNDNGDGSEKSGDDVETQSQASSCPWELVDSDHESYATIAKQKRAEITKARGFYWNGPRNDPAARQRQEGRIARLMKVLPCSLCKKFWKFGHWVKTCPQNPDAQKPIAVKPYKVHLTYCHRIWSSKFQKIPLFVGLVDTACAKSVVGKLRATRYIQMVESTFNVKVIAIDEKAPFKFGPGDRIFSAYALVVIFECADQRSRVAVEISVID